MCLFLTMRKRSARTKVRNLTDRPVDVQIRVGSILMKTYKLKPGCSKALSGSKIYRKYTPRGKNSFFYDGSCEPYVWIHSPTHAAKYFVSPMAPQQQYISLDDLQECLEMKICMDCNSGTFSLRNIPRRSEFLEDGFGFP